MDLLTALICITVAIVSGLVIYFISVSSMKEKTYDEVKAEQKKKAEEYLAQGRTAKEKAKDKKLKKAGKKVKEKPTSESIEVSSSEEVDHIKAHVAFAEAPIVVDEQPVVIDEKKRKKNKKKEKPILINKDEITPVIDVPEVPIINHFEQIVPKDDFSLKRSVSREDVQVKSAESLPTSQKQQPVNKQNKTQAKEHTNDAKVEKTHTQKQAQQSQKPIEKSTNIKSNEKPNPKPQEKSQNFPKSTEDVVLKTTAKHVQSTPVPTEHIPPSTKSNRKKRSELTSLQQMSGEKDAVNVNLLMPLVHKAELSRTEIQVLIDLLLNKQQGSSIDSAEWIEGRQDPVVKLKKQLAEKEKALAEEQEAGAALQSKLRELRTELNSEKHSLRQLEETLATRQSELGALGSRLQHTAEEKQGLLQQIQQLQSKLSEEHLLLCKLQEDQSQTQNALQQELLAQRQQLEMHIARLTEKHQETIATLEAQLGQMASQLQEQEAVNTQLSGELALVRERGQSQDLARQVKELHSEIERLKSKSQYDTSRLQNEVSSLTEQLNLKRAETEKLSSLVQNLQSENNRLAHQISSACVEAQQLRDENESLAAQVTASMERPATEGRENGDVTYTESKHHEVNSDKMHETELLLEKLKSDIVCKDKELTHFKTELAQHETLISSLKTDLSAAHVNSEKMLKEISSYKSLLQEQESVINALREEGDSAHKLVTTLREDINKSKTEIMRLSKDCVTREQLESRENTIEKLKSELNTHKTRLADQGALVQSLQKEIEHYKTMQNDRSSEDALTTQLNTYKNELSEKESAIKSLTSQVNRYETEIKQLQSELTSSKGSIAKLTEEVKEHTNKATLLSQELETQKQKNDASFKIQVVEKESAIKSLTSQVNRYETEIKQLQSELTSSKGSVAKLTEEAKEHTNKANLLSQELEAQKRKNDELRTKNWKAMEALSATEKTLETKVKQSQKLITEAVESARLEEQERTKQFLQRIHPNVSVATKQDYEVWLEQFMACAREGGSPADSSGGENHAAMLAEVEQQNCQLQAMVTHYKTIIADTEGMLNRLQSHVEQEEGRWGQQIQTLESQLEAVMQERDRLEENSELAAQLEEALMKNKELSKELARLQSLVLIGEKSFSDQAKETLQLKEQVEAIKASGKNGVSLVDSGCQTQHKRRNFAGWLRHKLRSRSRSRSRRRGRGRSHSYTGHQSS